MIVTREKGIRCDDIRFFMKNRPDDEKDISSPCNSIQRVAPRYKKEKTVRCACYTFSDIVAKWPYGYHDNGGTNGTIAVVVVVNAAYLINIVDGEPEVKNFSIAHFSTTRCYFIYRIRKR